MWLEITLQFFAVFLGAFLTFWLEATQKLLQGLEHHNHHE
jgi:hypothetical protein